MIPLGLAETIRVLRSKGYTEDFNLGQLRAPDDQLMIYQIFRFDVLSDPDDQSILYAIHSTKTGKKGVLVNGFGIYSETRINKMTDKLLKTTDHLGRLLGG